MKPTTTVAMLNLIDQIKANIDFNIPQSKLCADSNSCRGCCKKLLEYLSTELYGWENELQDNKAPTLGDINKLSKLAKNIYKVLELNNLVEKS